MELHQDFTKPLGVLMGIHKAHGDFVRALVWLSKASKAFTGPQCQDHLGYFPVSSSRGTLTFHIDSYKWHFMLIL